MHSFNNSKYTQKYLSICARAKSRANSSEYEHHHIFPKSIYPEFKSLSKNSWNGVYLTQREHFLCHWLLTKMFDNKKLKRKMDWALSYMYERFKSGWRYERARLASKNAMTGRHVSDAAKENMSKAQKKRYENGGEVNFKGCKHSKEICKRIGDKNRGSNNYWFGKKRPEHALKISTIFKNKPKSENHKSKIRETWHESRIPIECEHCGIMVTKSMHTRWHGNNCKKAKVYGI